MNKQTLKTNKELSHFFFENKLYEFSQKKLNTFERDLMKAMTEKSPEAKYSIGMVLMSLEYLTKIQGVQLEVDSTELIELAKKKSRIVKVLNVLFFTLLTICFFASGYILLNEFVLVPRP